MTPLETEAVFSAIGLQSILDAKPSLTRETFANAAAQPKRARKALLRFLASDGWDELEDLPEFDYEKTAQQVEPFQERPDKTNWLSPQQVNALFAAVPDHELATDLVAIAEHILQWASAALPKPEVDPVTGQPEGDPAKGDLMDFRRMWAVACEPMSILRDLAQGNLYDDQIKTISELFPETYQDIKTAALAYALPAMVTRRGKNWKPSPSKAAFLATLVGRSGFDAELAQMVQAANAQDAAQQAGPPKARPRAKSSTDSAEATPGQKAAAG